MAQSPSLSRQKLILWTSLLLIVAVCLFSYYTTSRLNALSGRAERSQAILANLNRFMSELQGVEAGARGYVITGNARFLAPQNAALAEVGGSLRRLRRLAAGDAALQRRLDSMEALSRRRVVLARELVARRADGRETASLIPVVEAGKASMDEIRRQLDSALAAEQAIQRRRELAVDRQVVLTNVAMAAGVALSLAAIVWLFAQRGREVARRRQAEDALKALNAELEDRVESRTAEIVRSRELLNAIVENMPDPVILKDAGGGFRYVLVNRAGEQLMGMDRAEIIGHVDHELFPYEQAALFLAEDQEVAASGQPRFCPARPLATMKGIRLVENRKVPIFEFERRPSLRARHRARPDRTEGARKPAPPGPADGRGRPPDRRHRPRFQQHPRHHPGQYRFAA